MLPLTDIASDLGLPEEFHEPHGRYIAKIRLDVLDRFPERRGKLILVTDKGTCFLFREFLRFA